MCRWQVVPRIPGVWRVALAFLLLAGSASLGQAQTGLTLRGDTVAGENGQEVRVVFRTEGFWEITEGMGTIQWDPQVIDYVSAGDFGIPELNGGTFTRVPEGMLTFDWSASNVLGNTLPDGSILFSLTFAVRGDAGDSTTVAFTDGWTPLHFESAESIDLPFTSDPGVVAVVPEPSAAALLAAAMAVCLIRRAVARPRRPRLE